MALVNGIQAANSSVPAAATGNTSGTASPVSFASLLESATSVNPTGATTLATMSDASIRALMSSGQPMAAVAQQLQQAGITLKQIANAAGTSAQAIQAIAEAGGITFGVGGAIQLNAPTDVAGMSSTARDALQKMQAFDPGFRIGQDANGNYQLQYYSPLFGAENMGQIRMSDGTAVGLAGNSTYTLFNPAIGLTDAEKQALALYMPDLNNTQIPYTAGGSPMAWSQAEYASAGSSSLHIVAG
jgi:uncharacterized protein with GYD domain